MADNSPAPKTEVPTGPTGDPPKRAVPQTTSLFRLMNFELFAKPNKVVMVAGVVAFSACVAMVAYWNVTAENRKNTYMALDDKGELQKRQRISRWD